ncbi:MAG: 4-(cytidine 5'-diphospho)-2-C-methyl-D-erythritol kinase, partial [Hyphomonadaceae bacterium]
TLHVGTAKKNGRHPLDSLVAFAGAEAADRITVEPADSLQFAVIGPFADQCGDLNDNLIFKAAYALQTVLQTDQGARVTLVKHLPVASGMGGGSADAGATLRMLNQLWGGPEAYDHLISVGAQLGGDIPACILSRPLMMRGEGERLVPATLPAPLPTLLVNSGTPCSTAQVFQTFDASGAGADFKEINPPQFKSTQSLLKWLTKTYNDLEAPAIVLHSEIARTLAVLKALPKVRFVRMSGSGATCFALFDTMDDARAAMAEIKSGQPDWWCAATELGAG